MLFLKDKLLDIEMRSNYLEAMLIALKFYQETGDGKFMEYAKDFGKLSEGLKRMIEHGDYSEREAERKRVDSYLNFKFV